VDSKDPKTTAHPHRGYCSAKDDKSEIQRNRHGLPKPFCGKRAGWLFYAGMGTNMMRAVPAATTTLAHTNTYLANLSSEDRRDQKLGPKDELEEFVAQAFRE